MKTNDENWGVKMWGGWNVGRRELEEQEGKWKRGRKSEKVHTHFLVPKRMCVCTG